jgi:ribosomal protein L9
VARVAKAAKRFPIQSAQAAYAAGFLTAAQQHANILMHGARSFGEAIDQYQKIEREIGEVAKTHLTNDLKAQGAKLDGMDFKLENTAKGLFVELVPVQLPPEVQKAVGEAEKQMAAKKAPAKPAAKRALTSVK